MRDGVGMTLSEKNKYFDFTVSATISGNTTINYAVTATKELDSTIPDTGVKVYLTNMDGEADSQILAPTKVSALQKTTSDVSGAPDDQYKLTSDTFSASSSHAYRLRMWVADDYRVSGDTQTFKLRVNVYGTAAAQ